jgi:hypothetical protein
MLEYLIQSNTTHEESMSAVLLSTMPAIIIISTPENN